MSTFTNRPTRVVWLVGSLALTLLGCPSMGDEPDRGVAVRPPPRLGERVTLEKARRLASYPIIEPAWKQAKAIDEVRVDPRPNGFGQTIIHYEDNSVAWWAPRSPQMKLISARDRAAEIDDPDRAFVVEVNGRDVLIQPRPRDRPGFATWFDGRIEHEISTVASAEELIRLARSMMHGR